MKQRIDLLHGDIVPALGKLALPIMATSFIQMAYNLIDMIWIGRVGSGAVAAVGAAGMYMWLSDGLSTMAKMGGQVRVGQCLGAKAVEQAKIYAKSSIQLGIMFACLFGVCSILFADVMIGFFNLNGLQVISDATIYLRITCGFVIFSYMNQIMTGLFTAMGNSRVCFIATSTGLLVNLILDPILIFGLMGLPKMSVLGAALATLIAQMTVFCIYLFIAKKEVLFEHMQVWKGIHKEEVKNIVKIGLPTSLQSMLFSGMSMTIARMIAVWGDGAVAVQKVGSQIESISWMSAEGFAAAVNSFMAQNYGAKQMDRLKKGYLSAVKIVAVWGIFCSVVLIAFPEVIFQIFIQEADVLHMGIDYLRILGISQFFMCMEITTSGAFSGMGRTIPPSVVGIVLTAARIPMAYFLSNTFLGLNGVWWSISISSILKGIVLVCWFVWFMNRQLKKI